MKKLVVANWKMYPDTLQEAKDLLLASSGAIVCPPFLYLEELAKIKSGAVLGAQDISLNKENSRAGGISSQMLIQFGVEYVIIGHSDRRYKIGESDDIVNKKLKLALNYRLTPIVCIGEKSRDENFQEFLRNQVMATFAGLTSSDLEKCLIAYEPVWAISTTPGAQPDTPQSAIQSISVIKDTLNTKYDIQNTYLYGGSVTSVNVGDFLIMNEFSGVLVGQASLDKEEIIKILEISSNV